MLTVKNLNFSFGHKKIFSNLSFKINSCGLFCIVGPNGAGKTTLLKLLMGYLKPDSGEINYADNNLLTLKAQKRAKIVSFVPQQIKAIFDLTTCEFVLSGRNPYLAPTIGYSSADVTICHKIAKQLKIEHLLKQNFSTLSAGETQKAQIARILIQDTPLILLDETLTHLDIKHQLETIKLLEDLGKTKTIILISHNLNLSLEYSQEILFLKKGKILQQGKPIKIVNEKLLQNTYDCPLTLDKNPHTNKPILLYH